MSNSAVLEQPATISLTNFLQLYDKKEDGYKYEWNDGLILKSERINQEQTLIFLLLQRLFVQTKAFQEGGGLATETDVMTSLTQLRRPDIVFFSGEQIQKIQEGKDQVPTWVAEVISKTDNINTVQQKLDEYFDAGVEVVWHIYPLSEQVYVYTAPDIVTICRNERLCSAAPAIVELEVEAQLLFQGI